MLSKIAKLTTLIFIATAITAPTAANAQTPALTQLVGTESPNEIGTVNRHAVKTLISGLPTAPRISRGTYDRTSQYGDWTTQSGSADNSYCGNTREDIRNRDLTGIRYKPNNQCQIQHGILENDPYTGRRIIFTRQAKPALEIDHIVPTEYHYDMMGYRQTQQQREAFYNDPANLIAAAASANSAKGSSGPATWLVPDNPAYVCTYLAKFSYIAQKYSMPIDPADKQAMLAGIDTCENTPHTTNSERPQNSAHKLIFVLVSIGSIAALLILLRQRFARI